MNLSRPLLLLVLTGAPACSSQVTDAAQCDPFTEPVPLATATIHVTNQRATSIYVSSCAPRFSIVVAGEMQSGELPTWSNTTCEDARTTDPGASGCEGGPVELAPGASFDVAWSGLSYLSETMPDACYPESTKTAREQSGETPTYPCYQGHALTPGAIDAVFHFLATPEGSSFDVTQTLQFASGSTVSVDVT
jgi:hypothetical protein